jgi:hypothetical protein
MRSRSGNYRRRTENDPGSRRSCCGRYLPSQTESAVPCSSSMARSMASIIVCNSTIVLQAFDDFGGSEAPARTFAVARRSSTSRSRAILMTSMLKRGLFLTGHAPPPLELHRQPAACKAKECRARTSGDILAQHDQREGRKLSRYLTPIPQNMAIGHAVKRDAPGQAKGCRGRVAVRANAPAATPTS